MSKGMTCRYCQDRIAIWMCDTCDSAVIGSCETCHNEVKHGQIKIQNVHIVGGTGEGHRSITESEEDSPWHHNNIRNLEG